MQKNISLSKKAYQEAKTVLNTCNRPVGFYASGLPNGYMAVWARDSMITSLGASLVENTYKTPFKKSLELLSQNQSERGQIPNAVGTYNTERRSDVTYNSIDSSLWYIIGHHVYKNAYGDSTLFKKYKKNIERAFVWLSYQDPNEDGLLVQQPTMDWQDAFPHKYGRTILTQALFYSVLLMMGYEKKAKHLKKVVNGEIEKYLALYNKKLGYYLPWAWKNHAGYREQEEWFDTFGNVMAIVSGLASPQISKSILRHIDAKKINRPFLCKAISPPIQPTDKEWHPYFVTSDAKTPYEYLNGGIWPFIGGFYVVALVKAKMFVRANKELEVLARTNKERIDKGEWGFQEWLHGKTGKPIDNSNAYQAWSAGSYLYAWHCVDKKKALFFNEAIMYS
jgi:glycogen debranching enzyme